MFVHTTYYKVHPSSPYPHYCHRTAETAVLLPISTTFFFAGASSPSSQLTTKVSSAAAVVLGSPALQGQFLGPPGLALGIPGAGRAPPHVWPSDAGRVTADPLRSKETHDIEVI